MRTSAAIEIDNRDASQMYEYLEARIDVLKRRIAELETENRSLAEYLLNFEDVNSVFARSGQ